MSEFPQPENKKPKPHQRVIFQDTVERNFITLGRAAQEFLLKPTQLEGLPKYSRRSPYESEVTITVYARKDVMQRAVEVWGSLENLEKEKKNREHYHKNISQLSPLEERTLERRFSQLDLFKSKGSLIYFGEFYAMAKHGNPENVDIHILA